MLMKIGDWRLGNLLDKRSPLTPLKKGGSRNSRNRGKAEIIQSPPSRLAKDKPEGRCYPIIILEFHRIFRQLHRGQTA